MISPLSHATVGDLILDSEFILREKWDSKTLLLQGYSLSLDKIRYSQGYPEKDEVYLTLYKQGKVVQKITVDERDFFFYNTTIDGTVYTIIRAQVTVFYGVGVPNFIKLDPFLQYSDGTAFEPFMADTIFQVPGIMAPVEEWNRTFGGPDHEEYSEFLLHTSEGYTIAGQSISYPNNDYLDTVWLIHTDHNGSEQWNLTLEEVVGYGYSIDRTREGGYIILGGARNSQTWDKKDAYLIKLDKNGDQEWKKTIKNLNPTYSIRQTADGGYIIVGLRLTHELGNLVNRLIKTDEHGSEQWSRNLAGFYFSSPLVHQTLDGGYILAGDIFPDKVMLFKTDADGNEQWQLTIAGDHLDSIIQTREGDYVFAGRTGYDAWLVEVDAQGYKQWDRTFGLEGYDYADSVLQTQDGGFILAGQLDSAKDPDFKDQILYNNPDAWLIKTNLRGNLEWSRSFGGLRDDRASAVLQAADGGYILVGSIDSSGSTDIWMIKIADTGNNTSSIPDLNETPTLSMPCFELTGVLILIFLLIRLVKERSK